MRGGFAVVCLIQVMALSPLCPYLACRMLKIDYKVRICVYLICNFPMVMIYLFQHRFNTRFGETFATVEG